MAKSGVVQWNAGKLKAVLRADVEERLETAAAYLEDQARRNLVGIGSPRKWTKYRHAIARNGLTHKLVKKGKNLEAVVYMKTQIELGGKQKTSQRFGFYIEVGSIKYGPAHPWLRPALLNNQDALRAILGAK